MVIGGAGDDVIVGGGGNDKLGGDLDPAIADPGTGPAGNDRIFGDGVLIALHTANNFLVLRSGRYQRDQQRDRRRGHHLRSPGQ